MLKKIISLLGVRSPAYTWMSQLFSGATRVGQDHFGNTYYRANPRPGYKKERRIVRYKGEVEASRVPPEWHGWLHHQSDVVPHPDASSFRRPWQKPHQENLTGTTGAYRPEGHVLSGGRRARASGDYEAWSPEE